MIMPGAPAPTHRHSGDAVELVFEGDVPKAIFLPAGTVHAGPAAPPNGRAVIFEMK
jgi:quercetin dioxygenase-like cupin family protein